MRWAIRAAVALAVLFLVLVYALTDPSSLLIFAGILASMVLGGWLWGRWRGFKPRYLASWAFDDGETVLWRDDAADIMIVPRWNRPLILRPWRLHRYRVLATNERILVATPELFTGKLRVLYVLYPGSAPNWESTGYTGGALKTGYQALVVRPDGLAIHPREGRHPAYVGLQPDAAVLSSFGCAEFRIYTDEYASFRMPGVPGSASIVAGTGPGVSREA